MISRFQVFAPNLAVSKPLGGKFAVGKDASIRLKVLDSVFSTVVKYQIWDEIFLLTSIDESPSR
jgi:hypothetical protein